MATDTQNHGHDNGNGHHHEHAHGDGHPQGPRQEAVNPEDRPYNSEHHNPRVGELPENIAKFLRDIEAEREDPCPDELVDELKGKIANGEKIEVHSLKVCGRENCPEHKGKNSLADVLAKVLGELKDELSKKAAAREQRKMEAEAAERQKKVGKHFLGKANCDSCGVNPAKHAVLADPGKHKDLEQALENGEDFVKPICSTCANVTRKVIGAFWFNAMLAPCPNCVPYPVVEGKEPNRWAVYCDKHHQDFLVLTTNSVND